MPQGPIQCIQQTRRGSSHAPLGALLPHIIRIRVCSLSQPTHSVARRRFHHYAVEFCVNRTQILLRLYRQPLPTKQSELMLLHSERHHCVDHHCTERMAFIHACNTPSAHTDAWKCFCMTSFMLCCYVCRGENTGQGWMAFAQWHVDASPSRNAMRTGVWSQCFVHSVSVCGSRHSRNDESSASERRGETEWEDVCVVGSKLSRHRV